jgi:DNA polymerase III subunit beta
VKVSCLQENLARGLSIVGRAVASRSTLPILANVLLATDHGRLRLSATNLEIGINTWVGAQVEGEGAITIPARLLADFVNSLPPERVDMRLDEETQTLNLRCAKFDANIKGIGAAEFPSVPTATANAEPLKLEPQTLRQLIEQVAFAAATDESRPILTGVLAEFNGQGLTMAAADGFRLSVRTAVLDQPAEEGIRVIVPARALAELGRVIGDQEEPVLVMMTSAASQILFHMKDVDLVSQLIEGRFPDYQQIMPQDCQTRTVLDRSSFLNAARVSYLFARDSGNIVKLEIIPGETEGLIGGHVTLAATSQELGDNIGELDASVDGDPVEIAFNAKFLIDVLSALDSAQVVLETSTASSPGLFRAVGDEDFTHVIMPMHISR